MNKCLLHLFALLVMFCLVTAAMAAPVVSNVRASQRTDGSGMVDVYYDVSGGSGTLMVSLIISNNSGTSWTVLPSQSMLTGDFGNGIANGANKHIVWDAGRDRANVDWPHCKARVTAGETGQTMTIMLPGGLPLEMVRIPAGSFQMGSGVSQYSQSNEIPVHPVNISYDFYLGKYEVTQAQWWALMGSNPSYQTGNVNYPVDNVSWDACQAFITTLNTLGQGTFRLPTETEWEYACRAGTTTQWSFGDDIGQINNYAWYTQGMDHVVGGKLPNPFGLYDMHGNLWEWVQDWYHDTYSGAPTDGSAWVSPTGSNRVLRGGSFNGGLVACRSAFRYSSRPDGHDGTCGIRLARTQ